MTPKLVSARYVIHIAFADGTQAELDLEPELWGEVFEPLKDRELFRGFLLNEELNTLTWPTGADLASEFLYGRAAESSR